MRAAQAGASPTRRARKRVVGGVIDKLLSKVRMYTYYIEPQQLTQGRLTLLASFSPSSPVHPYLCVEADASISRI